MTFTLCQYINKKYCIFYNKDTYIIINNYIIKYDIAYFAFDEKQLVKENLQVTQ